MTRSRIAMLFVAALATLALPATARAQSAFAGVVKDATGAVLPGVTVEASSPALIERVRSVTTDANGAYKIENLRPGTYTLTLNCPASPASRREPIGRQRTFTPTINARLKAAARKERFTVPAESRVVTFRGTGRR